MKNKKIIAGAIILAALSTTSMASADFDCSSVDRETVKEIMDKKKSWETLTSTQEEILENMKECKPQRWGNENWEGGMWKRGVNGDNEESENSWKKWNRMWEKWEDKPELTDEQKEEREEMKEIMEKKKNGESLTDDEQEKYDEFIEKKWDKKESKKWKRPVKNLSTKLKTNIGTAVNKVSSVYSNLSDEQKIVKYEKLQTKLETALDKIQNSTSISDTKKDLYENIINEMLNSLDEKIEEIS